MYMGFYWLHRDPKCFPNPDKFDPDRFLPENVQNRPHFAFLPFSAGHRNCIGEYFFFTQENRIAETADQTWIL